MELERSQEKRDPAKGEAPDVAADVAPDVEKLFRDGITSRKGAFPTAFIDRLREEMMTAFWDAIQRPGGAIGRGPRRWYVELHPQAISVFVELATHPWITAMCEAVLGPAYEIVEIGFDVPFEGAKNQPWHRDFPSPPETYAGRRLTSLAFNFSGVDVTPDMGPFEVAPGTQWEDGLDWKHRMFPPDERRAFYAERAVRAFPRRGDVSCRSALTVHRGTAHASPVARPVLVIGVDAPGAGHAALHDLTVTQDFYDRLPEGLRRHLVCRVVEKLEPITQKHGIEGLTAGADY